MVTEAETGVLWPQARECWPSPEAPGASEPILPQSLQRERCPDPTVVLGPNEIGDADSGLLAFSEKNSSWPSRQVYATLLQQQWETDTDRQTCPLMTV